MGNLKKDKEQKKARKEVKFKTVEQKKLSFREKLFRKLYANEGEGIYTLVSFLPFFIGSWISGGMLLDQLKPFVVATFVILTITYGKTLLFSRKLIFKREFVIILIATTIALLFYYHYLTALIAPTLFLGLASLLSFLEASIQNSSPYRIILKSFSLIIRMCIYALLGIVTQRFNKYPDLVFEHMVFGFVPGSILAGSLICKYSQVFLNHGWKRSKLVKNRKGVEVLQPGSLTRLLSSFLIVGPAIPLLLTPFDVFPTPFLVTALVFTLIIKNLEFYVKNEKPDAILATGLANIALLMSILLLVIGLLIRIGVT